MRLLFCVPLFALLAGQAAAAEPTLFALFKSVCFDTRNDPAAVDAAARAAGAQPQPSTDSTMSKWTDSAGQFTVTLQDAPFWPAQGFGAGARVCSVEQAGYDEQSLLAVQKDFRWPVGPPHRPAPGAKPSM